MDPGVSGEEGWGEAGEESQEEGEDEGGEVEGGEAPAGILDQSEWQLDRSMMWQAFEAVEAAGSEGVSQQELGARLGQVGIIHALFC